MLLDGDGVRNKLMALTVTSVSNYVGGTHGSLGSESAQIEKVIKGLKPRWLSDPKGLGGTTMSIGDQSEGYYNILHFHHKVP